MSDRNLPQTGIGNGQAPLRRYGTEQFGTLKAVLLHKPVASLPIVNGDNFHFFLYDKIPDVERYLAEHQAYSDLLKSLGVQVFELSDWVADNNDLLCRLPNLAYLHDTGVVTGRGAILSKMSSGGREHEEIVVKEALKNLGIPIYYEFSEGQQFEGCLLLSPQTLFVAETERHSRRSIEHFIPVALQLFSEVIYVTIPKLRRFMHSDMIFNRVNEHLALAYLPAFVTTTQYTRKGSNAILDFPAFMKERGMEVLAVSDEEQQRWATSFVPLKSDTIVHYDIALNTHTKKELARRGVEIIEFHPDALLAGGGSLRCLTLRLLRS
ncbi:MAG TPA: arginine deiminase family protein [Syntrophomonadaceae bacterium]|nr:arginine deiminase family protein [Syntrophomonadaceae bacterium]